MARWLSPTWVVTSWVREDWFGDGTTPSPGNWVGTNWLRPGYILNSYLTNAGVAPTSRFVSDTLGVSLTETASPLIKLTRTDSLSVSFTESFSLLYTRHVVAFDTVTITLNEQRLSEVILAVSDTISVSLTETSSNSVVELVQLSAEDTLDVELDDPGIVQDIQVVDTLDASVDETSTPLTSLLRSDTLAISLGEVTSKTFTGAIAVSVSDSLGVSLGETASRQIFNPILVSDTLSISVQETAVVQPGIITVYLQAFDVLSLGLDESAEVSGETDTVAKYGSDSFGITLSEATSKVELRFISVDDTLLLQIIDESGIQKISIQQTWEDAQYPWGGSTLRDIKPLPVFAFDFDFYQADSADSFISSSGQQGIPVVLERLGLTIYGRDRQGNWKEDPDIIKLVKGLYPIFRGEIGTVINIYVGSQEDMGGPVTWDGPHPFIIGESSYVTPLISGPFIGIRFESAGQKPWKLLSYQLDITNVGRRN